MDVTFIGPPEGIPFSLLKSLKEGISFRKRNRIPEAKEAFCSILRVIRSYDSVSYRDELETKEIKKKIDKIQSRIENFPTECSKVLGYILLIIRNLQPVLAICFIAGTNAFELGLFEIAFHFFSFANKFLKTAKEAPLLRVIVAIRNNMGCAQVMMGENPSASNLQNLLCKMMPKTRLHDIVANNLASAHLRHNDTDSAISLINIPFNNLALWRTCWSKTKGERIIDCLNDLRKESWVKPNFQLDHECQSPQSDVSTSVQERHLSDKDDQQRNSHEKCNFSDSTYYYLVVLINFIDAFCQNTAHYYLVDIEDIAFDKFTNLPGCQNILKAVHCSIASYLVSQGNVKKAQEEMEDLVLIDVPSILKGFRENDFCATDLILSGRIASALISVGERTIAKTLLESGIGVSIHLYDVYHPISLYLSKALEELIVNPRDHLTIVSLDNICEYSLKTLSMVFGSLDSQLAKSDVWKQHQFKLMLDMNCFSEETSLSIESGFCSKGPEQYLTLSLSICTGMLSQGGLDMENQPLVDDSNDLLELLRKVSITSVDAFDYPKAMYPNPSYWLHAIAGLCFLLETALATNALPPNHVCEILVEVMEYHAEKKKTATESPNLEMYKDFYGNISFYVSYREITVSGKPSRLCNIITCGRYEPENNEDEDNTKKEQPLFKATALKTSSYQEATESSFFSTVLIHRARSLLDIRELRKINEKSLDNLSLSLDAVIEFVPSWSSIAERLGIGLELLRIVELEQSDLKEFYAHEYQKKITFTMKTEPALLQAALHHHFKVKVLAEEVYKSGEDQITIFFTNHKHGVLKLVTKDEHLLLILKILRPSPSEVDAIPNDITRICDEVITKCKNNFELCLESESPWLRVTGGIQDSINEETRDNNLEIALEENLKLRKVNAYLKNKVRDLTKVCDELQDNVPCLDITATRSQTDDTIQLTETSNDEQDDLVYDDTCNQDGDDFSLCSLDNEQTRSLSLEHEVHEDGKTASNDANHLLEIGESEYRRQNAERNLYKFVSLQQDVQSFKRRNLSRETHSTQGAIQGTTNNAGESSASYCPSRDVDECLLKPGIGTDKSCLDNDFDTLGTSSDQRIIEYGNCLSAVKSFPNTNQFIHKEADSSYDDSFIVERGALFEVTDDGKQNAIDSDSSLESFQSATESFIGACGGPPKSETKSKLEQASEERDSLQIPEYGKTLTVLGKDPYNYGFESLNSSTTTKQEDLLPTFTSKAKKQERRNANDEARCASVEQKRAGRAPLHSTKFRNAETVVADGPSSTHSQELLISDDVPRKSGDQALASDPFLAERVVSDCKLISGCGKDSSNILDPCLSMKKECVTGSQDELMKHSENIVSDGCLVLNTQVVTQIVRPSKVKSKPVDNRNEEIPAHKEPMASGSHNETIRPMKNQQISTRVLTPGATWCGKSNVIQNLSELNLQTSESTCALQEEDRANSKPILITGLPGMGKSLFCQKLVRDMTQEYLPFSSLSTKVTFAFLVPFHQLNIFGRRNCTLRDLLNHFSLPGNNSVIDKSRFEQIMRQPQQVMLVFDGYDEYSYREDILDNDFEQQYTNDPRIDMPPPVIVSKILRQKILGRGHVVITSRPDEAKELRRINITDSKEISGLSYIEMKNLMDESFQSKPSNQGLSMVSSLTEKELELELANVISQRSLPPLQRAANPVDHKMQEGHYLFQTLCDEELGQQGENLKQRRNRVVSQGDDKQPYYSRLRDYFNTFSDARRDEITDVVSDTHPWVSSSSFLGKYFNDSGLHDDGGAPSPFMSMPILNNQEDARTTTVPLKEFVTVEFQSKSDNRNLAESLNTSKVICDGPQDQLKGNPLSQLSDNFNDSFNTEYAEECGNKSSLHIAKDIRDKQSEMHSAINLATTLQSCEQYEEAISYGRKCLHIAKELDDKNMEMRAILNIATTYQNLERYEDAIVLNLHCQELSQEMGSPEMEARAVMNLSIIYQAIHRINDAVELSKKCIQLSKASGDKSMVMKAARDIGVIYQTNNKYHDSIHYYQMCLEISCETSDKEIEMHVSRNLAVIHQHLNQVHEAISYYKRSFEISKELGDKDIELSTAKSLASIYMSLNQLVDAVAYSQRCLQIAQEKGEKQMQIEIAENLVKAYKVLNEHENAVFYYKILFQIAKEQDDKEMEMQTSREIAILYQGMSQKEVDAVLNNERCLKIAVELGDKKMEMDVTSDLTTIFKKMNQIGHAIEHCERCFEIANQLGYKKMAMCRAVDLGEFYKISEQFKDAVVYYKRARALAEEIGDREKEMQANREMAVMYKSLNKPKDALACLTRSQKIAEEIGDRDQEIQVNREMAVIYKSLNKLDDALACFTRSVETAKEIGDKVTEMATCRDLATMFISEDKFQEAIGYHERSLKIAKELSDRQTEMNIYMNLVTLYKALHKYDKAIEAARVYWNMARQMTDSNVEIKACLLLIGLYESQGIYDEVFLFSRRGLEIAKENGDKKAEVIICLAVGEACHSLEQIKTHSQWENVSKDIEGKAASIRKAMKLKTLNRRSDRSKGAMNVAASNRTSNPLEGESGSGTSSQSDPDKGASDLSRGIIEVVMGMEIPMTLNEVYDSLTKNHITPSEEQKCIHLAKEIWVAFEGFNVRSHVTPQAQESNRKKAERASFGDRSSEGKNSNKSSKTCATTKTSIDQPLGSDGTTTNGHPSAPGGDFESKGSLSKRSSSYKDTSSFDSSSTTSYESQTLNSTCTGSVNERPSDNVTLSEVGNQTADTTSLPVCNVVSSNSDNTDTSSSECALRSLEESVGIARETMGSLMTQSMYDMDHRLRETRRRERELRRRREQEEIDRILAAKKLKELEKHDKSLQPASLPIQIEDDDLVSCTHFKRGCDMFFPCCQTFYQCHRCHNQSDACDVNDSKAADATHLRCRTCMTVQEITPQGSHCIHCKRKLSEYFCGICKHFTANDKQPYHCDPCGICRIHKDNSFHCEVCNVCLNKRLRGRHKCRPNSGHDECCICLEDAFSGCQVLPCSHKVHRECAVQMIRNGVRTCPICRAPIYE